MKNPATPLRASLVHDNWIEAMTRIAAGSENPACQELAIFAAEVLTRCGDTPELTEYLNARALKAMGA